MVATDTVVGIVGAVLLAGVMVGVFVYEYNNAPAGASNPPGPTGDKGVFAKAYPKLNATEDLDGDGTPNYQDPDMDGNHVNDTMQSGDLRIGKPITGSTPMAPSPGYSQTYPVTVLKGGLTLHAVLNYTVTSPVPQLRAPSLDLTLTKDGQSAASSSGPQQTGSSVTVTLDASQLAPGTYQLTITQSVPGPQTPYSGSYFVDYGPAHPAA